MRARDWVVRLGVFAAVTGSILTARGQTHAGPEQATLVVYSGGSLARAMLPRSNALVFYGGIFDGDKAMARLSYRSILILHMQPGGHTFSASASDWHPAKNSQIYLELAAGHTYYLRAMMEHDNFSLVSSDHGRLEPVSCDTAHQETLKHKLTPDNYIGDEYKKSVIDDVPACSSPSAH